MTKKKSATTETKKMKYLEALMTTTSKKAACKVAHISRATANRYEHDDEFQANYRKLQQQSMEFTGNRLRKLSSKAVDALAEVMDNPEANPTEKTRAAKIVLDSAFHVQENEDILQRLDKLESEAQEQ